MEVPYYMSYSGKTSKGIQNKDLTSLISISSLSLIEVYHFQLFIHHHKRKFFNLHRNNSYVRKKLNYQEANLNFMLRNSKGGGIWILD